MGTGPSFPAALDRATAPGDYIEVRSRWRQIAVTDCGAPVVTPIDWRTRRKNFRRDCVAFVSHGRIFVKHAKLWDDPGIRAHEIAHLEQERWFRTPAEFLAIYTWCDKVVGYDRNPFEVAAKRAEARAKKRAR